MNVKTETKETCWLCERENSSKQIAWCENHDVYIGRDKTKAVGFWTKYKNDVVCTFEKIYKPKFCPECGRDLTEEEKQMKDPIISYGFIANGTTYTIQKHNDYYSFWFVDAIPTDMTIKGIENFMDEHCLDGCSVSGTYEQIITELANLIIDLH